MLAERDFRVLRKYKEGRIIEPSDEFVVHSYQLIGLCTSGVHIDSRTNEAMETSRLTSLGQRVVEYEEMLRSPVKRFFHSFWHTFAP